VKAMNKTKDYKTWNFPVFCERGEIIPRYQVAPGTIVFVKNKRKLQLATVYRNSFRYINLKQGRSRSSNDNPKEIRVCYYYSQNGSCKPVVENVKVESIKVCVVGGKIANIKDWHYKSAEVFLKIQLMNMDPEAYGRQAELKLSDGSTILVSKLRTSPIPQTPLQALLYPPVSPPQGPAVQGKSRSQNSAVAPATGKPRTRGGSLDQKNILTPRRKRSGVATPPEDTTNLPPPTRGDTTDFTMGDDDDEDGPSNTPAKSPAAEPAVRRISQVDRRRRLGGVSRRPSRLIEMEKRRIRRTRFRQQRNL